jgi:hypothetical protein
MYDLGEIARLCVLGAPDRRHGHHGRAGASGAGWAPSNASLRPSPNWCRRCPRLTTAASRSSTGTTSGCGPWRHDRARIFRYGLTPEADLWADEMRRHGHGRHPLPLSLPAAWPSARSNRCISRAAAGPPQRAHCAVRRGDCPGGRAGLGRDRRRVCRARGRASCAWWSCAGINGSTVIDDTYNASPASTIAALNLLADISPARGRRVAVLGDMRELGSYETDEGHKLVGRRAADLVDVLVTVGELGAASARSARSAGFARADLHILTAHGATPSSLLRQIMHPDDLVLVKGSRAVGMESSSRCHRPPTARRHRAAGGGAGAWIIRWNRAWPMRWRWAR